MEIGAAVWVLEDEMWREAAVIAVDEQAGVVECSIEQEITDEQLKLEGDDGASNEDEFLPAPHRKRRNSRLNRRGSMRRLHAVPVAKVLPRNHGEAYHMVEDLTKLVHLHEPAILQVLRHRFFHGLIYTSTGSILVALNPFRRLDLYSESVKEKYYRLGADKEAAKQLAPHVYTVADKAFRTMLSVMRDNKVNQTILVSGESGAGKTETTKLIMNYLAYVSTCRSAATNKNNAAKGQPTIHDRVLESNPILEAFGNARTNRNNNSSRFGKFIKLGFTSTGEMLGAQISTYLLERVRLVSQAKGERNYHIFYELCKGASNEDRDVLVLRDVTEYKYLNTSECYIRLDGVDDAKSYQETRHAMTSIGMDNDEQLHVMRVVSAVLHLGNISFVSEKGRDSSTIDSSPSSLDSLEAICKLLGVEQQVLHNTMCTKQIKAGAEFITTKLTVSQATSTRDSVVKTLYSNLFNWLVARINSSIQYKEERGSQFIGVVDIFGFEIFEENCLEQLCINYANEKLQQLFGRFVFRMEQETYVSEDIPWQFVDYPNNDICVTMLERRQMGLFSLLDEQCLIPKGNDEKLANKYNEQLLKESSYSVSKLQRAKGQFVIHHYAGDVCYSTNGFCDKNKDHMHTEAIDLLKTSKFGFVRSIFESADGVSSPTAAKKKMDDRGSDIRRRSGIMSSTVVAQFKSQLTSLLEVLNATEPHFIRCVKPNDEASSAVFEKKRALEQLRCSGVLEAVKISRSGYPVRFVHDVFIKNYSCILSQQSKIPESQLKQVALEFVTNFTAKFNLQTDSKRPPFQVGKTKVFCVPEAHNALEAARAKALYKSVITLQRYCLGYTVRVAYQRQRQSAILIQSSWRRISCRRRYLYVIQRQRSAIKLQSHVRGFLSRRVVRQVKAVTVIQSFVRGWLVRREYSANTLSFEHDVSYVGSIDRTTDGSFGSSFSMQSQKNPLVSIHSAPASERGGSDFISEINDPEGRYGGHSPNHYRDSKKRLAAYEPPKEIKNEYEIVWECGLLGLYFESDPMSGMPIVRRVHESLSNCADIFEVSRGDVLLAVGKVKVKKGDIRRILSLLQEVQKPVRLHFLRNPTESFRMRSGSIELLGEEDYEVLWKEGVPLGLGFRPDAASGYPSVMQANGNQGLPGMFNVRIGDFLIFINEFSTQGVRFQKVIDILESGPRPAVLRFRHNDMADDDLDLRGSNPQEDDRFMRQSCMSLNPKVDHSLYYITWKEDDGPLGIVVKQESTSYYPRVINVKNEGAVTRESQKNRVEVGDVLLSINNNNISKMGFGAAMRLLQKGPKPLLLMFQRPRLSFTRDPAKSLNL